jgi:hypothetical protein
MDLFWQVFAEKPSAIGAGVFAIAVLESKHYNTTTTLYICT